jgi:hypothetical protein
MQQPGGFEPDAGCRAGYGGDLAAELSGHIVSSLVSCFQAAA